MLDEILQELEDAIQVIMDCDLHPEGQRCIVRYLARRIAHEKIEAVNYLETKRKTKMRGYGIALFTFLDKVAKTEDAVKEEMVDMDDQAGV